MWTDKERPYLMRSWGEASSSMILSFWDAQSIHNILYAHKQKQQRSQRVFLFVVCEPSKHQILNEGPTNIAVGFQLIVAPGRMFVLSQETIGWLVTPQYCPWRLPGGCTSTCTSVLPVYLVWTFRCIQCTFTARTLVSSLLGNKPQPGIGQNLAQILFENFENFGP